jgi:hypothetical protein
MATALSVSADMSAEREFLWEEANSRMVSAQTPEDFLAAALVYRELAGNGVRNGSLFYNMGVALMLAGQHERALYAFRRAEHYTGSSEEIRRNMMICLAGYEKEEDVSLPWHRFLLFWHYGLPGSTRMAIAAVAFSLCWLAVAAGSVGYRRLSRPVLTVAFLALVLFGSSAATTLHQESRERFSIRETAERVGDQALPVKN